MWNFRIFRWGPWESWVSQFDWKGGYTIRNVFIWKIMTNHRAFGCIPLHTPLSRPTYCLFQQLSTVIIQGSRTPTFFEESKQSADGFRMLSFSDYMDLFETMLPRIPLLNHHFRHVGHLHHDRQTVLPCNISQQHVQHYISSVYITRLSTSCWFCFSHWVVISPPLFICSRYFFHTSSLHHLYLASCFQWASIAPELEKSYSTYIYYNIYNHKSIYIIDNHGIIYIYI